MNKKSLVIAIAALAWAWIALPTLHDCLHLCPVRPDGVPQARAVPAFARKYNLSCMQCHYAFPVLNAYGRQFKMNGYVRERGNEDGVLKSQDEELWTEKLFPWALIVRSRPYDNGNGSMVNQGAQMGATASPNPNGTKLQPINDLDFFVAGGDAVRAISFFGEADANTTASNLSLGDLRLGYHPSNYLNFVAARRGFFVDDPYQTISSAESPTIAGRATDLVMANQGSISGSLITATQKTVSLYGHAPLGTGPAFLYYAAGATQNDDFGAPVADRPAGLNLRLAFDNGKGLMLGAFDSFGRAGPLDPSVFTGGPSGSVRPNYSRVGVDVLAEKGGLAARGAFVATRDEDSLSGDVARDQAFYLELAYAYKRGYDQYPFLLPLVRENWFSTFNGSQKFNYVTAQLAHYFAPNFKGFIEYSIDTKGGYQGGTLANPATGTLVSLGNRASAQLEVGF